MKAFSPLVYIHLHIRMQMSEIRQPSQVSLRLPRSENVILYAVQICLHFLHQEGRSLEVTHPPA